MKLLISGLHGHMGSLLARTAIADGAKKIVGVDQAPCTERELSDLPCAASFDGADADVDCIVDFSHHSLTKDLLAFALSHKLPLVLATTGQTEEEKAAIKDAAKEIPVFFAPNYSIGVSLLVDLAKRAAKALPGAEIEIIERHHDRKVDAPSGTALALANSLCEVRPDSKIVPGRTGDGKREQNEIVIHSLRMGNLAGVHEVILGTNSQTITLKHEVHDRGVFAEGALAAAKFLVEKAPGLYDMHDLIP
ncbi:MAG: 4-hydroxy-tetrahydrodipicolinate reductase [Clostridia bacterium]|nr:4-hydroxy-tetrahydrodipicolinate reductase [Clostridia bacterium]